jgi:hypothetical protein
MSVQNEYINQKTAKPVVAGIFNIVIGAGCLLGALGLGMVGLFAIPCFSFLPYAVPGFMGLVAVPLALLGILVLIGGIFAVQRRQWGWALAGSIAAACISHILGIISIVLISISKQEFDG